MLADELGYRAPSAAERLATAIRGLVRPRPTGPVPPIQLAVLQRDPLILYSGVSPSAPLGLASLMPPEFGAMRATFLLSPTWTIESENAIRTVRRLAIGHRGRSPGQTLLFLCNSPNEVALLQRFGEAAILHNKTSATSEAIFRPLPDVAVEFDAIYNAQIAPFKRHELSLEIERCAFIYYRDSSTAESERALIERHKAAAPGHVFLNALDDSGRPVRFDQATVNRHLNRAAVGLCLSAREGAMFASTEYMLAGLPVVSTPSLGGRDTYFEDDYCIIAPADPRSIRDAVAALAARCIPRDYVRSRTLAKVEKDRARFIEIINRILAEAGSEERLSMPWPFQKSPLMEWMPAAAAVERVLSESASQSKRSGGPAAYAAASSIRGS
jgi:glycosyltransferase involved in cell wall biosynthesis